MLRGRWKTTVRGNLQEENPIKDEIPSSVIIRVQEKGWMDETGMTLRVDVTATGRMKRPIILEVCTWVKNSLEAVKEETTIGSFKKCEISNAIDGTDDDMTEGRNTNGGINETNDSAESEDEL